MRLHRTAQAEIDLIEIWQFIAKDDPMAASKVLKSLDRRSHELLKNPKLGPARPDINTDYRHLVDGNFLILYQIKMGRIEIVRYLHGAQNLKSI